MKRINLRNIIRIYSILKLRSLVKNKYGIICFVLLSVNNRYKLVLKKDIQLVINRDQIDVMIMFLNVLKYSMEFSRIDSKTIEISFDKENKFRISLDLSSFENKNLIKLFYYGINNGAIFKMTTPKNGSIIHKKIIRILDFEGKKILETYDGLRFYLDSVDPWIFVETFILRIHDIPDVENLDKKIIVDIGANVGDTAIFYANKGAVVYAFEPVKEHYDSMIRNIHLNPELKNKIIPVNAAIGKDGMLTLYQSSKAKIAAGASIFFKTHDDSQISKVIGYSFDAMFEKFNIKTIDLLKMDCKGCEFFLTRENLKDVKNVKIEYTIFGDHKIEDITRILQNGGFEYIIYQHNPNVESLLTHGTIFAKKKL